MPVGPCDGCTQAEGNVSTVSPIMTVLSISLCSKRATVASTQSSTAQQASLPRPFMPAIQAKSAPRCSVRAARSGLDAGLLRRYLPKACKEREATAEDPWQERHNH